MKSIKGKKMNKPNLLSKYKKALQLDMRFKDITTAMEFLQDLGGKLPDMFEFSPPKNNDEHIRATEGGQTIILHKDCTMSTEGQKMPVVVCEEFCNIVGKYSVWDIMHNNVGNYIK
jgi:hypothetical protein